ncbi:hypothetical protein MC7420_168 [Coleofasciculus chthonoplastes PCC 7420]|uniref:Uncharacterized protein n=1 Tax=Coleofasciculus chthonoplastes PCC 7420 TaxID=118168 RepID=B4W5E9_9CYAN|nr:hypothetical protein MC7420_168 [Coleofasciculus chthonoplastes PCC 7420]
MVKLHLDSYEGTEKIWLRKYLKVSTCKIQFYLLLSINPPILCKMRKIVIFIYKRNRDLPVKGKQALSIRKTLSKLHKTPGQIYKIL